LRDSMVATKELIWSCLYSMKVFTAYKLMTLISDGNKTKPNMA